MKRITVVAIIVISYLSAAMANERMNLKKPSNSKIESLSSGGHVRIYSSNQDISKVLFNITEGISSQRGTSVNLAFKNSVEIKNDIKDGKKLDLIITDDYDLLLNLNKEGFVNFLNVGEVFYDKLVYVSIEEGHGFESPQEKAIFFKTYEHDREIFDVANEKLPSVLIQSANVCKKINAVKVLYGESYKYLILKESVAKKCDLKPVAFFDNLYNLYYIAIVLTDNFHLAKETLSYITESKNIKEIIKKNGYSN